MWNLTHRVTAHYPYGYDVLTLRLGKATPWGRISLLEARLGAGRRCSFAAASFVIPVSLCKFAAIND